MQLIVISSADNIAGEAAIINSLFNAGLTRFHLRKPGNSIAETCALLNGINPVFYDRIGLHQHHALAPTYGITRLHYTEQMRMQTTASALKSQQKNGYKLSTSIHDAQLIPSLTAFDYVFIGPVFDSLSKPGYRSSMRPDFQLNNKPAGPQVIALGGVQHHHLLTVKVMGFNGAAVLGAIWNHPEKAIQTFEQLQASIPD
ncbi:thiamine phosphate synthase [Mucilaginibacter sp. Bleaf8]|uniref:thiamine phosphate synthase n=1 Tax=Mucilaginibacter sp. Bleaf8 TaxID=2834430 RepID=UPI001BD103D5|nr:thiamine phosphate synthase [Mucilaginibacter sp. Bleaf8]MBS7562941.1 thiamine phosphate synthase [Mucilaginibacter sp. Bleaf8]